MSGSLRRPTGLKSGKLARIYPHESPKAQYRITTTVWDDVTRISQQGNNNMSNETQWVVKYKLPGDQVRTPREIIVTATSQADAKKVGQAMIPDAIILGGPQQLR